MCTVRPRWHYVLRMAIGGARYSEHVQVQKLKARWKLLLASLGAPQDPTYNLQLSSFYFILHTEYVVVHSSESSQGAEHVIGHGAKLSLPQIKWPLGMFHEVRVISVGV